MEPKASNDRLQLDYQLVCDARDHGSHKAYADLMASYREPLYLLLLRMTHNTTTASDLTMETFSKASSSSTATPPRAPSARGSSPSA